MWLLSFLPDYFFHFSTLLGFVGALACLFPIPYKTTVQVLSIAVISFSLYIEGGISNEEEWKLKVKEAEAKVAQKETQAAETTVKVVTKYVKTVETIKEKGDVIIKEIPMYITKVDDSKCAVPNGFVMLHDSASRNEVSDTARIADAGSSSVKISEVAGTVVENYTTYHEVSAQLKALQQWVKEQQAIYNK
jgi:hypothetical protein